MLLACGKWKLTHRRLAPFHWGILDSSFRHVWSMSREGLAWTGPSPSPPTQVCWRTPKPEEVCPMKLLWIFPYALLSSPWSLSHKCGSGRNNVQGVENAECIKQKIKKNLPPEVHKTYHQQPGKALYKILSICKIQSHVSVLILKVGKD